MAASASDIEEFLTGPLVKWLSTCVKRPETLQVYETFFDGAPINEVLLQIDPEPSQPVPSTSNLQGTVACSTNGLSLKHFSNLPENLLEVLVSLLLMSDNFSDFLDKLYFHLGNFN
uniref:Uncharacterized protein LOC114333338 n=1 Tax=Diabrotica virgifera virgifera TaxID=50390 RepID=A0A6P7G1S0_DIAVI